MEEFNHKHYNYTWTKGFIIAICITLLLISGAVFGQTVTAGSISTPSGYSIDLITGNLIGYDSSLKTNNGVTSSLGSFAGSFNATDGYTFSYVNETIGFAGINLGGFNPGYQNTSAVFVTGFMYGLKYRFPCANSIGGSCDNTSGPQDTLQVEIGYYPYSGSPDFRIHQLGLKNINDGYSAYNPTWQQLAETYTFAGAKPLAQAGAVNMSIIGQDAGFWACLMPDCYGPQVKDAYVRAMYSVDPCILNPAYSPNCPGFINVLQGPQSPTFYYSYNIAQSLPHIGGGVQLHGYDYGFSWYNYGACYNTFIAWCTDWRTDGGGNINFRISDKNNNTMFYNQWYVEGNNSGGGFSARHLFTESQNSLNMGSVQWWTDSVWNHFGWTGWTRPIWTPDPCYEQPLYSPNCTNFNAEIKRLADEQNKIQKSSLDQTVANISTTSPTPSGTVTNTVTDANTTNPTVSTTTTFTTNDTTTTTNSPKSTSTNTTTEAVAQRDSVSQTSTRTESVRENNTTSFALSLISKNQERETNIAMQASQNAIREGEQRGMQSMRQAEKMVVEQQRQNQGNPQEFTSTSTSEFKLQTQNNSMSVFAPSSATSVVSLQVLPNFANPQVKQQSTTQSFHVDVTSQSNTFALVAPTSQTQLASVVAVTPANIQQQMIQVNTTQQVTEIDRRNDLKENITQTNFITDKTNPITDLVENNKPVMPSSQTQKNTQQVKSNVQDNDAAAGVSIVSIARTPIGFNTYLVALNDAAFYAPKEIYRNQKTIDNVRALRQLASDRLHQQMVNQQYLPR